MSEITTCEQYVLAELEELRAEVEALREDNESLRGTILRLCWLIDGFQDVARHASETRADLLRRLRGEGDCGE